ncbi:MAG: antitoxin [Geodermatophilaceae bacterium]|jgi:predicted transcriptional regulator|nr:antitoxin [Geodermatophilaceae bacterium]
MRTTIDLPEDLHEIARSIARDRSQTLSETVADLLRRGLSRDASLRVETDPLTGFLVLHGTGPVTSESVRALEDDA